MGGGQSQAGGGWGLDECSGLQGKAAGWASGARGRRGAARRGLQAAVLRYSQRLEHKVRSGPHTEIRGVLGELGAFAAV